MQDFPEELEEQEESGLYEHFRLTVDQGQSLLRIDKYLGNRLNSTSRSRLQAAASAGNILVNKTSVKSNYRVKPGDEIVIVLDFPRHELKIIPEEIPLDIIYEDDDLLVINKQPGLVVHPGHGNYTGTLVNALAYYYHDLPLFEGGDLRTGLVHRIDKDTSGLLVIAKTEIAKNKLAMQFFKKTTQRQYNALVWGIPKESEGTISGFIGRSLKDRQVFTVFPEGDHGKHAVTHYRVAESIGYVSMVECRLETGRTHQIRVHMKHIGHPVFNDATYGGDQILRGTTFTKYKQFVMNCFKIMPRQALHARTLGFTHPTTGKNLFFEAPLPQDFTLLVDKWRDYITNRTN